MDDIVYLILIIIIVVYGIYAWSKHKEEPVVKKKKKIEKYGNFSDGRRKNSNLELNEKFKSSKSRKVKFDSEYEHEYEVEPDYVNYFTQSENQINDEVASGECYFLPSEMQDENIPVREIPMKEEKNRQEIEKSVEVRDVQSGNWETNYGQPLATCDQKKAYAKKLAEGNKSYINALSAIHDYTTDESTIIRPTLIDPFRQPELFKGKPIRTLYDQMTQNVKAKPKEVSGITGGVTTYDDDKLYNGGVDGAVDFSTADYGDAF